MLHSPESPESQERVKFEAEYSPWGAPKRPYIHRDYPMMMHLAGPPQGGMGAITIIESETVDGPGLHQDHLHSRGFRPTPLEALAHYEATQTEYMKLSGNLEYQKKNTLSERAAAEVTAAQNAHNGHLPMVPETPIRRRVKRAAKAQE